MTFVSSVTSGAVVNARIRTLDPDLPRAEALSWTDGRITAVGSAADVLATVPPGTEPVDLGGACLTPGLIDSHLHPAWGAELSRGADMAGHTDLDRLRDALRAEAARTPDGVWVRAWNVDYAAFTQTGISAQLIDEAVGHRPFIGVFYDLHTAVVSTAAIRESALTGREVFPDAAAVVTDDTGRPTGELKEPSAYLPLMEAQAETDPAAVLDRLAGVLKELNRFGVTGGVVMDADAGQLDTYAALEDTGRLSVRLVAALWHHPDRDDAGVAEFVKLATRRGRRWRSGMVKIFSDGVIDTGTAWLREPDTCGCGSHPFWPDPQRLRNVIHQYTAAGIQLAIHAVGDQAVSFVLDCYRDADGTARHRLEHLELLTDDDVKRLAEQQVTASMQPLHMQWRQADHSDAFARRLGRRRAAQAFRVADVITAGGPVCLGSDWPVADSDPRYGMAWARLRRTPGDRNGHVFEPEQRLTGEQALLGYTAWAAEALGENDRGRIRVGARADLTAFAADPLQVDADDLIDLPIPLTVVDGEIVHREDV
ncbi:amidohydrolase [Mycolicibacterium mageritense]|uniref:amidohydrolase n=1 Tax=Mycolicibacterium mageritense TaxID=53462 RepID=UPI001E605936|nr:amidohydrolase [Mycolicibacterium mageritense]MBN3458269.1 amidohydrolase [Mycobacterium sp. DSM 3803]GJJ21145.1 hydrolase [Mycolicibacterium mageritense]